MRLRRARPISLRHSMQGQPPSNYFAGMSTTGAPCTRNYQQYPAHYQDGAYAAAAAQAAAGEDGAAAPPAAPAATEAPRAAAAEQQARPLKRQHPA